MVINPKDWNVEDPSPDEALSEINPLSARAWSMFVRSKERQVVQDGFVNLVGAIDMMHGLEYHYARFCAVITTIAELSLLNSVAESNRRYLVHEAVAYLNRLGQFMYFCESDFVTERVPHSQTIVSTIAKYIRYRHKHSAHRSIDKPRKGDSSRLQQLHAWTFSSIGPMLFSPKPGKEGMPIEEYIQNPGGMWADSYACFQLMGDDENDTLNLSVEREHPVFIAEAYKIISGLLSLE